MTTINQTMSYEIQFNKELYNILNMISFSIWRVKTRATTLAYDWKQYSFSYKERFGKYPKENDILGVSHRADVNRMTKPLAPNVHSSIVNSACKLALDKFNQYEDDILKGNKSIITYKREGSFPIRAQSINGLEKINPSTYKVKLSLLSRPGAKEFNTGTQQLVTLKTGRGSYHILDRILDGTYKMSDSLIKKRKGKYYLLLAYKFEVDKDELLDPNRIMGIDMGIVNPVYMAFNDLPQRYNIEGNEVSKFRKGIQARRNSMLRQIKYAGKGRQGHGRNTALKPIEKLQNRVEDFKDTTNHKYSKLVVEMALKHKCGVIQMENLTGIADGEKKKTFLGSWTYFDLQKKIEYKAKKHGIEVIKIDPKYTSQRCSKCGVIHKENRDGKVNQAKFECVTCGYKANADYNAAKNIATPNIEEIIKEQLEFQGSLAQKQLI